MKDLVFGQAKIMESLSRKLASNDKILENINNRMDSFSSAIKKYHSSNKIIESQIAQLAAVVPSTDKGKILGQPEDPKTINFSISAMQDSIENHRLEDGKMTRCPSRKVIQEDLSSP